MPVDQNARTAAHLVATPETAQKFRSLRWRILTPLIAALMVALMISVYGISYAFLEGERDQSAEALLDESANVAAGALEVGRAHRTEAQRIAYTSGVIPAIQNNDPVLLRDTVEPLATLGNLDLVIISVDSREILSLQRRVLSGESQYVTATDSNIWNIDAVQRVQTGGESASSLLMVERRPMLVTAMPVLDEAGGRVGVILVGQDVTRILRDMKPSEEVELALFAETALFGATFPGAMALTIETEQYQETVMSFDAVLINQLDINETAYQIAYFPLVVDNQALGVVAVYQPAKSASAANFGRQITSLLLAIVIGTACIVGYLALGHTTWRMENVRRVADGLARGEKIRTRMKPHDEIGRLGAALDRYATVADVQANQLHNDLQQQRREAMHLQSILEHLPDGVLVQDLEGRVITMNAKARQYLGISGTSKQADVLREWTVIATEKIGAALAPGIHALEETLQIAIDNAYYGINAAALLTMGQKRVGTVVVMHDITDTIQRDTQREHLIEEIASDVHVSISRRAQVAALEASSRHSLPAYSDTLRVLAREMSHDARALQRMITEYRDLALLKQDELRQHPLNLIDLLIQLAETWRPVALGADITLDVALPDDETLYILGDEKRLLWAIGNVIDNAVKYSLRGTLVALMVRPMIERSRVVIKVMDEGAGIAKEDQQHLFTRFYRGTPISRTGQKLEIPGTGQGLYLALKVIEAHGGQMALASAPGEGTQVTIALPLTADVAIAIPRAALEDSASLRVSTWDQPTGQVRVPRTVK